MKNIKFLTTLLCTCLIFLTGCNKTQSAGAMQIDEEYPQGGFINPAGSQMVETPEGYYAFKNDYLYYITPDLQKSTILCAKPECLHNENPSADPYELANCDAYFKDGIVAYYKNHLYIASISKDSILTSTIYKISMDGSECSVFYDPEQHMNGFCIYKNDLYFGASSYSTEGKVSLIQKLSMDDPENSQIIFETSAQPDSTLNRLEIHGGYAYFYFPPTINSQCCYYRVDLETGKADKIFESENTGTFLYTHNYGSIVDDQYIIEISEKQETFMGNIYYKIAPGETSTIPLSEEEFPILAKKPMLYNMDEQYVYFGSSVNFSITKENWPDDASLYVCTYDGELAATIPTPAKDFIGKLCYVLPGNDDYMFVETVDSNAEERYYYAPKAEFGDGTVVQLKEIPME